MTTFLQMTQDGVLKGVLQGTKEELRAQIESDLKESLTKLEEYINGLELEIANCSEESNSDNAKKYQLKAQLEANKEQLDIVKAKKPEDFKFFELEEASL